MDKKTEITEKELKDVNGGIFQPSISTGKCRACKYSWETNRPDYYRSCPKCGSSNIYYS